MATLTREAITHKAHREEEAEPEERARPAICRQQADQQRAEKRVVLEKCEAAKVPATFVVQRAVE
jgi:hypothetical protein